MKDYSIQNKRAWEYNAYEFWVKQMGAPAERAKKIRENPIKQLKQYSAYFDTYDGVKIANICGSCGKKAVPLALLGAKKHLGIDKASKILKTANKWKNKKRLDISI